MPRHHECAGLGEGNKSPEPWTLVYITAHDLADAPFALAIVYGDSDTSRTGTASRSSAHVRASSFGAGA